MQRRVMRDGHKNNDVSGKDDKNAHDERLSNTKNINDTSEEKRNVAKQLPKCGNDSTQRNNTANVLIIKGGK